MPVLKRKKLYNIQSSNNFCTSFIFVKYNTPKINNKEKILLNNTYFLVNNNTFITIKKKIKENDIINFLKETYNIDCKSKMLINRTKTHNIFLIYLDFDNNESFKNLNNYTWRKFIDFYYYNDNSHVFLNVINYRSRTVENDILHKSSNNHLNYKIISNLHDESWVRLKHIYNNILVLLD